MENAKRQKMVALSFLMAVFATACSGESVKHTRKAATGSQEAEGMAYLDEFSRSGRPPRSLNHSVADRPDLKDSSMQNSTCHFWANTPPFPFGCGLTYATFACGKLLVVAHHKGDASLPVSVMLTSSGERSGQENVQIDIQHTNRADPAMPRAKRNAFGAIDVSPAERKTVALEIPADNIWRFSATGALTQASGVMTVSAGGSQPNVRRASQQRRAKLQSKVFKGKDNGE